MRFIKAHIYGFGKWLDEPFTFNKHGITCIIGDNESGKSTFQAFISFILFGLPPKEREFYRPKTSGTLGGELVVLLDSGEEVTIRRMDGQKKCNAICLLASGEEKDEKWLTTMLKGMTSDLFASTFQFTTEDLYEFEQIELDHIGEVLLNTSISGASDMYKIEKQLERQLDDLFKPRGTLPKINKQLNHLEKIRNQLHEHAHMTEDYRKLIESIAQNNQEINRLQEQLIEARKKRITWEQVETALPFIQQYEQAEKNLHNVKRISINEDGPEQLADKKQLQQEYMSNDAIIQQNIDRYLKEMEDITLVNLEVIATGNAILQEKEDWSYHIRVQNDLEREKENLQTEINTRMNPFVNLITVEILNDLTISPFIEKRWRELAREAETLDSSRTERAESVGNEKNTGIKLDEKIMKASTKILPKEQYNKIKETLDKDEEARSNAMYRQQVAQEKSNQKEEIRRSYQQAVKFLLGSNGLAILFVVLAIFTQVTWFYHGAIISAALGWIQWYFKRKEYTGFKAPKNQTFAEDETRLTENAGIALREQVDAHVNATELIVFLERQKEEAVQVYAELENELNELIREEEQLNKQIEEEVLLYPFLDRIELPYWEEVGHVLQDVQALHRKLTEILTHIEENKRNIDAFEQNVKHYSETMFKEGVNEPHSTLLSKIEQIIQDDVKYRQRHEKIHFEHQEAVENQRQIKDKLKQVKKEIHAILFEANVDTEADFFKQHEKYIQQQEQLQRVEGAEKQLKLIFSAATWNRFVHQEVESHTIHYELLTCRELIATLEKDIEEVRSALATSTAELNHLEKSDSVSYSEQMHAYEVEKTLLQELATKWAVHQVANSTLQKTKQGYMSKHLENVLEQATEHFTAITDQRYIAIHGDIRTTQISVVDASNTHYTPKELSKGTRDQLYIAIRLAMSEHIQENAPYPFIFDDTFVHFDENRTKRMIQLIVHLAQKQQVILFTCKDDIQEILGTYVRENEVSMVRIQ